jgi:hypothetical protein
MTGVLLARYRSFQVGQLGDEMAIQMLWHRHTEEEVSGTQQERSRVRSLTLAGPYMSPDATQSLNALDP